MRVECCEESTTETAGRAKGAQPPRGRYKIQLRAKAHTQVQDAADVVVTAMRRGSDAGGLLRVAARNDAVARQRALPRTLWRVKTASQPSERRAANGA